MALKYATNNALSNTTALPSAVPTDNLILISTQTASNSANISFTTGLDSTYDMYEFKFINIHPRTDTANFTFQGSTNSGSSYGVTITSTAFRAHVDDAGGTEQIVYLTSNDLAQSTSYQMFYNNGSSDSDDGSNGTLQLFNPSSTTYVKHWIYNGAYVGANDACIENFYAGYFNTTSAINAIDFKMSSGNFDGTIKLYGVKKS